MREFAKDPSAVLDYGIDWSTWLSGDTISSSSWVVPTGITKGADVFDGASTTIWLSGGTKGERYKLVNTITTTAGRTDQRTITVVGRDK